MKTKVEYIEHLELKLIGYGVQIDRLSVTKGASKRQYPPELMALKAKCKAVREEIQALAQTGTEACGTDLESAETAWNAMSYGKVIKNG